MIDWIDIAMGLDEIAEQLELVGDPDCMAVAALLRRAEEICNDVAGDGDE